MPKPTTCGVQVLTWGTKPERSNGMLSFLDAKLFGGNVGHASIVLTIPADASGKALIERYCDKYHIPYEENTVTVKSTNGETLLKEEVYTIHWSWWPSFENTRVLGRSGRDILLEAEGYHEDMSAEAKAIFQPEERSHKGTMGSRVMTSNLTNIAHQRQLTPEDYQRLQSLSQLRHCDNLIESIDLLLEKFSKKNLSKPISLSQTEILLLNRNLPDWRKSLSDDKAISISEFKELQAKAEAKKISYQTQFFSVSLNIPFEDSAKVADQLFDSLDNINSLIKKHRADKNEKLFISKKDADFLKGIFPELTNLFEEVDSLTKAEETETRMSDLLPTLSYP